MQSLIFPFSVLLIAVILLGYLVTRKTKKLPEVAGLEPYYTENVGGRFGLMHYTFPLVKIALYDQCITITHFNQILLRWNDIAEVRLKVGLFNKGVEIIHNRTDLPELIIIWSRNSDKLLELIQAKVKA